MITARGAIPNFTSGELRGEILLGSAKLCNFDGCVGEPPKVVSLPAVYDVLVSHFSENGATAT